MKKNHLLPFVALITLTIYIASCDKIHHLDCSDGDNGKISVKVFASGFNSPRGLKFGPDGNLYVAEAGIGGKDSTVGKCDQVAGASYKGSTTGGRVSRVSHSGVVSIITDKLPSSQARGSSEGVSDVQFVGNTLYALLAGAGCSHGVDSIPNGIVKLNNNGTWSMIANISDWLKAHPVQHPEPGDFDPDGTPYSMIYANGDFYVMEPNHGDFIKVTTAGVITRVADISASQGHVVPTSVAYHNGNFYAGNLNPFPIVPGSSNIYKITPAGHVTVFLQGFTTILGVAYDEIGRLYVLENTTVAGFPAPGTGNIVRISLGGKRDTLVSKLNLPTAMTFGSDGRLYVSNKGFGPEATGGGEVLQITLKDCWNKDLDPQGK